jgi:uncharacterized DUF497 family protein
MGPGQGGQQPPKAPCQLSRSGDGPEDPLSTTYPDPDHSLEERRFVTIGVSAKGRVLVVAHADRRAAVRINQREASNFARAQAL